MRQKLAMVLIVACLAVYGQGAIFKSKNNMDLLTKAARKCEVGEMSMPSWAQSPGKAVGKIAWISDTHLGGEQAYFERIILMMKQLRDDLKPDLVIVTGDNHSKGAAQMKNLLINGLDCPYAVIPGDNWPWDFHKVFGSRTYSFDFAGVHFLFGSVDAKSKENDGCAVFYPDTKSWLKHDILRNRGKAIIYVQHEPLYPPVFLDAEWMADEVSKHVNVIGAFGGHLHFDLEFSRSTWKQFVCPSLSRSHRPAFKLVCIYGDQIILHSYEWEESSKSFKHANKWQRMVIPAYLRRQGDAVISNRREMPERAIQEDSSLVKRASELDEGLMVFLGSYGLKTLFTR